MERLLTGLLIGLVILANLSGVTRAAPDMPAAPGDLDTSFAGFGTLGRADLPVSQESYTIPKIALQPDGKIVTVGNKYSSGLVRRLFSDGTMDLEFGDFGTVMIVTLYTNSIGAVAIQADGYIVAAGYIQAGDGDFLIARLDPSGELDPYFGNGGLVVTDFDGGADGAMGVVIQPDGKIVAAGSAEDGGDLDFAAARYNPDGTLDTSFDVDGKVTIGFGELERCYDVALLEDGDLVLVGEIVPDLLDTDFAVARLNPDGTLDTGFDGDGRLTTGFGGDDDAHAVAIQPDGKIVAAGSDYDNVRLARYQPDGTLDSSFDGDGKLSIDSLDGSLRDVAIQPDGKIVLLGWSSDKYILYRLNPDASLDPTFDADGIAYFDLGGNDYGYSLALQSDGRILASGMSGNIAVLIRLWPDGTLDTGGQQALDFADPFLGPDALELVSDLALQPDGKIVLAGDIGNAPDSERNFALARFLPDGMLDTSFGTLGKISFGFGAKEVAKAVAVQPDGKILAAGTTGLGSAPNIMLARFLPDGMPDTSFGFLGYRVVDFGGAEDYGLALALAPDGKIVVAGYNHEGLQRGSPMVAVRFNSDGTLDDTFDLDGKFQREVVLNAGNAAYAVVVQPDLKIVLAGTGGGDFALLRLNEDGSLDEGFGTAGEIVTDMGNTDTIFGLARQEDGALVVAGSSANATGSDFALARYTTGGELDLTYGSGGKVYVDLGVTAAAYALDLRPDGVAVAAGCIDGIFVLAQVLPDGQLDDGFNSVGTTATNFMGEGECAYAVKFTEADKIVAAGVQHAFTNANMALARFVTTPAQPPPPGGSSLFLPLVVR
jgi:uncharacterized delta-60 repeat protein